MSYRKLREEYNEGPEDHFDDPADYQESIGNKYEANMIRKQRRQVENGEREGDEY